MRIPESRTCRLYRLRGRAVASDLYGRLPFGAGLSASLKIPADAGLSPWRASIPDAEHAPLPVASSATAMLRGFNI
jgi:hypothetical protein